MEKPAQTSLRPDYGIDAPGVVRNLMVAGSVALLVSVLSYTGLLPWAGLARSLAPMAVACLGMGSYMIYSSKVSKLREREQQLDLISWRGDETVLDVGCGLGLVLLGAAKRLTTGRAAGIDIWQTNTPAFCARTA
jgi:arsenite methyltransferase